MSNLAVRLDDALESAGVASELHTVAGGGHGGFDTAETLAIFTTIQQFLSRHGL